MKIGFVLDDSLDSTDGVQQYVLLLGSWLAKRGHNIHYLVGESKRDDIKNVHSLSKNIRVSFNKNRLSVPLPSSSKRLKDLLNDQQFDILHIQMPFSPFLAGKIISLAPKTVKIVGTFHIAPYSKSVFLGTKLLAMIQANNLACFDAIISVSAVAQEFALKSLKRESQIIPNAVDFRRYLPKSVKNKEIDIIFVGRLVARKGCIFLLKALSVANRQFPQKHLNVAIVGDGPERKRLENFVRLNKLDKWCKFYGFVNETKKLQLMQSSRLAVFPSTGGESFGIVLIEAMASGVAVLAGNNPGYTSVMGKDSKALFDPINYHKLSELIIEMLDNTNNYQSLKNEQQLRVKEFDIEKVGSAIMQVYMKSLKAK